MKQIKMQFFELFERHETKIALENENNSLLQPTNILLQNQTKKIDAY
jgi:hypothetical protein